MIVRCCRAWVLLWVVWLTWGCGPLDIPCTGDTCVAAQDGGDGDAQIDAATPDSQVGIDGSDAAASLCLADHYVVGGSCVGCLPGSTNEAGDDPAGGNTACDVLLCDVNKRVQDHSCVDCPVGASNEAGDDATGADTACDDYCAGTDVVLREPLVGSAAGVVNGGSFGTEGWTTGATSDQIFWDLGSVVDTGSVTFEARGFHHNVGGCLAGVCYYVGLFEEANGDKGGDYLGSPFIESRYHNDLQQNFHDTFKLQTGVGDGFIQEPMMPEGIGWDPSEWHTFGIEWGSGESRFYIDGNHQLTAHYATTVPIAWRYLFLGTTNYKGFGWAATGITYRRLCLRQ
jgi:hypothetical protein